MNWLTPAAGFFLAAAVIPPLVLLYFLRLKRKEQPIATTLLWHRSVEDLRANAPFQRLRWSTLLLLQLLALALLCLAVMQPQIRAGRQAGGRRVIMIDASASMACHDGKDEDGNVTNNVTRLDEAKRRARNLVEELYGGGLFSSSAGETMVITFADGAEILQRFTDSRQQLLAAIDRVAQTHSETSLHEALKLARAYTTNSVDAKGELRPIDDPPIIELFSDGRINDAQDEAQRETIRYYPIGSTSSDNVAIAAISVDRPFDRPASVEVFAALVNFNPEPANCDLQLSVDDAARGIQATTIPAATADPATGQLVPGRANIVFTPFEQPAAAVIEIANLRNDLLPADDVAHLVIPAPKRLRVALVAPNPQRSLIARVLEGMSLEKIEIMSPQRFDSLAAQGGLDAFDVLIFDNCAPSSMPPARYLTFGPTPPVEGFTEFGTGGGQVILNTREEHPVLRYVSTDTLFINSSRLLQAGNDVDVLAEASSGPAVLSVSRGPLQVIHVTFDPLESNWPFQRSFVTFIFNAVDFLGHAGEALSERGLRPGQAIAARLPASATSIHIHTPDGADIPVTTPDPAQFTWGPIRLAGLHTVSWSESGESDRMQRVFAVNLLSETEGRVDAAPDLILGTETIAGQGERANTYTAIWPWAVGLCVFILMLEWWVYHRKMSV